MHPHSCIIFCAFADDDLPLPAVAAVSSSCITRFLHWRPETALRIGDNTSTGPYSAGAGYRWTAELANPAHPEYPSSAIFGCCLPSGIFLMLACLPACLLPPTATHRTGKLFF